MFEFFKLEFVNAYTQEVLRENFYEDASQIQDIIKTFEGTVDIDEDTYIFDFQQRALVAEYQNHSAMGQGNTLTYKLFFKVRLSGYQYQIK